MADASYRPNFSAWSAIANGPEVRALVAEVAEKAKSIAEGLAQDFRKTGEYASSFEVTVDSAVVSGRRRAVATLTNTADHAAAVEWGNARDPKPHHTLGRTLDQLGHE